MIPLGRLRHKKDQYLKTDPDSPFYGSERYCPLPPAENTLSVPLYAGEKL